MNKTQMTKQTTSHVARRGGQPTIAPRVSSLGAPTVRIRTENVFMLDLLPAVPYYTGHLCQALKEQDADVALGSPAYSHDPSFFRRMDLRRASGLFDFCARFTIGNKTLRRAAKLLEYLLNVAILPIRFLVARPAVLHVQFLQLIEHRLPFEVWLLYLAHALGIRIVYTAHNTTPHDSGARYHDSYKHIYKLVDRIICHDKHAKEILTSSFGIEHTKITVIPHGPLFAEGPNETTDDVRQKLELSDNTRVVLWQGIIRPYKGVQFLLDAWKRATERGLDAVLIIVGTGEDSLCSALREKVSDLGLGHCVKLDLRFASVNELSAYYRAADILVYPYSAITTSGALMTGLGYSKAIIASALPGFEDVLTHGRNALLLPCNDVDGWADALLQLCTHPEMWQRLAQGARQTYTSGPSWSEIAKQTAMLYRALSQGDSCLAGVSHDSVGGERQSQALATSLPHSTRSI